MLVAIACAHVAVGLTHVDREIAHVAVVSEDLSPLLVSCIRPSRPVTSHLFPLTGLTPEMTAKATPLSEVVATMRQRGIASPTTTFFGRKVDTLLRELGLERGSDFAAAVDFDAVFTYVDPQFHGRSTFTVEHLAAQGKVPPPPANFAHGCMPSVALAYRCMRLHVLFAADAAARERFLAAAVLASEEPTVEERLGLVYEGVCLAGRYPSRCRCAAATPSVAVSSVPAVSALGKLSVARRRKERRMRKKLIAKESRASDERSTTESRADSAIVDGLGSLGLLPDPLPTPPSNAGVGSGHRNSKQRTRQGSQHNTSGAKPCQQQQPFHPLPLQPPNAWPPPVPGPSYFFPMAVPPMAFGAPPPQVFCGMPPNSAHMFQPPQGQGSFLMPMYYPGSGSPGAGGSASWPQQGTPADFTVTSSKH
jgi:hypothetical protein